MESINAYLSESSNVGWDKSNLIESVLSSAYEADYPASSPKTMMIISTFLAMRAANISMGVKQNDSDTLFDACDTIGVFEIDALQYPYKKAIKFLREQGFNVK